MQSLLPCRTFCPPWPTKKPGCRDRYTPSVFFFQPIRSPYPETRGKPDPVADTPIGSSFRALLLLRPLRRIVAFCTEPCFGTLSDKHVLPSPSLARDVFPRLSRNCAPIAL